MGLIDTTLRTCEEESEKGSKERDGEASGNDRQAGGTEGAEESRREGSETGQV